MKKVITSSKLAIAGLGSMFLLGTNAHAALTVNALDTDDFMAVAGVVVVALGAIWAVKKALSLLR